MEVVIEAVLTGVVRMLTDEATSAIAKTPVTGAQAVGWLGLENDHQADLSVHGGPDKALHHYPRDHYAFWQDTLADRALLGQAGAFGENISTTGLTETTACIGDRYRLGTALVEISQGRQPCWKQAHRLGDAAVVGQMVATRRCGWYYRVIEQGVVAAGDRIILVDRPHSDASVAGVIGLILGGGGKRDRDAVGRLARLDVLAESWRKRAAKLSRG